MILKDNNVYDSIEKLKGHYQIFTSNKFIKSYLFESAISKNDWIDIEDLIDSNHYYEAEGYNLLKLYDQIVTFISFLKRLEKEVIPKMKNELLARLNTLSSDNKILFKMTINNAPGNVQTFYGIMKELFLNVKHLDASANGEYNMLLKEKSYLKIIEEKLLT